MHAKGCWRERWACMGLVWCETYESVRAETLSRAASLLEGEFYPLF